MHEAETLLGPKLFDPLLLLLLSMNEEVLKKQTVHGAKLLSQLEPLIQMHGKDLLIAEAKKYILEMLPQELQWRLDAKHMPKVEYKGRKDDLLSQQNTACKEALFPSLMQMVYKNKYRKHCMAPKWVDALHAEMLEILLLPEDSKSGHNNHNRSIMVIEFPNDFQCIHKFYIDWDKKLSEAGFTTTSSSALGCMQKNLLVEKMRNIALGTPLAVVKILTAAGPDVFKFLDGGCGENIRVLVKEGTRKMLDSSEEDWKISFHFVFQVVFPPFFSAAAPHKLLDCLIDYCL